MTQQYPQSTTGSTAQFGQGGQMGQQTGMGQQSQFGGQSQQGAQSQTGGQQGGRLSQAEPPQQRQALQDVYEAVKECAWCADQCIQEANPGMIECIRLCEDVTELGTTALEIVPRQSRQSRTVLRALDQAIQACAQECGQHAAGHCQECAEVLQRASQSVQQLEQTVPQ